MEYRHHHYSPQLYQYFDLWWLKYIPLLLLFPHFVLPTPADRQSPRFVELISICSTNESSIVV